MSSITVINSIEVPQGKMEQILGSLGKFSDYFSQQAGYVSSTLHQSANPDAKFPLVNISKWESIEQFQTALSSDDFYKLAGTIEEFTSYPEVYQTL